MTTRSTSTKHDSFLTQDHTTTKTTATTNKKLQALGTPPRYNRRTNLDVDDDKDNLQILNDQDAAAECWHLMQTESPPAHDARTKRSSLQHFPSFRTNASAEPSPNANASAWAENPKFAHLKERQPDPSPKEQHEALARCALELSRGKYIESLDQRNGNSIATAAAKNQAMGSGSGAKRGTVARTTSMPALPQHSPEIIRHSRLSLEDPFTPPPSDDATGFGRAEFAQLSITSDRIQRSVSQTGSSVDALLESQRTTEKSVLELHSGTVKLGRRVEELVLRQQGREAHMLELQTAVSQGASKIESLSSAVDESTAKVKTLLERPEPDFGDSMKALQAQVAQNTTQLKTLLDGQKTARRNLQKMQVLVDQQAASQKMLADQVQASQASNLQNQKFIQDLVISQNNRFEKMMSSFERQSKIQQDAVKAAHKESISAIIDSYNDTITAVKAATPTCNHEVAPPPRKMNRKLVGYVYSKNGD